MPAIPGQNQPQKPIAKRAYGYTTSHQTIAAGGSSVQTITISADSSFVLNRMMFMADISGADQTDSTRVIPLCTIQIRETSTGNDMFSDPVPLPAVFGTGAIPFIFPEPKRYEPNSTIQVTVGNYSAATTYNLRLVYFGYRLYFM